MENWNMKDEIKHHQKDGKRGGQCEGADKHELFLKLRNDLKQPKLLCCQWKPPVSVLSLDYSLLSLYKHRYFFFHRKITHFPTFFANE
jgi:hypothetical protein